jgi:hypothetical protein
MARYYKIDIFKPTNTTATPDRTWTSIAFNQNDPGALNVVLDAYVYSSDAAEQQTFVQIWGVAIADIQQASNFNGYKIKIYAGFSAGLPLNKPAQAGLIVQGTIYQSFANWQGTDMSLDFVVILTGALASQNANISFFWKAGTPLADALKTSLNAAFPGVPLQIAISPALVLSHDQPGHYTSLTAFNQALRPITVDILNNSLYLGVSISMTASGLLVYDGTTKLTPTQIAFEDMIGQPTWIGPGPQTIQFACAMRADLAVGSLVTLPKGFLGNPGAVTTTPASQPQLKQQSIFQGSFMLTTVHHIGEFRQPDGLAWITVFNAVSQMTTSS